MGDGGVACMPSQNLVGRFSVTEKLCGGNGEVSFLPEVKMKELEKRGGSSFAEKAWKADERPRDTDCKRGEFGHDRKREGESEKAECQDNGELEKGEFVLDTGEELENGEFVPDRFKKSEIEISQLWSRKGQKVAQLEIGEVHPGNWRKWDRGRSPDHTLWKKDDGTRNELDRMKKSSLKSFSHDRQEGIGSYKNGNSNGKNNGKEDSSGSWLKRHNMDSGFSGKEHQSELVDRSGPKSRKVLDVNANSRPGHLEKSHRSNDSIPSKTSSTDRHSSSRQNYSSVLPRGKNDKHGKSTESQLERSSLYSRTKHQNNRSRSPTHMERSHRDLPHRHDSRDRTTVRSEKSPRERPRHHDQKHWPTGRPEHSPRQMSRHREHKDNASVHSEQPARDCGRAPDQHETSRKSIGGERKHNQYDDMTSRKESDDRVSLRHNSSRHSNVIRCNSSLDKSTGDEFQNDKDLLVCKLEDTELLPPPPPPAFLPRPTLPSPPLAIGPQEELPSMEEDMDICDTPPHLAPMAELGKWYYLDHFGIERGPSRLMDLKKLVEEGALLSDHLIKHSESDRWVTVENAASPLVPVHSPSIVSDAVTQMVSPPEPTGNLLFDAEDFPQEIPGSTSAQGHDLHTAESLVDFKIDERVGILLDGHDIIPGREVETVGEALGTVFLHADWENWGHSEGFTRSRARSSDLPRYLRDDDASKALDCMPQDNGETRIAATSEKEPCFRVSDSTDWFSCRWSCKGGDWKRNDDSSQDRYPKRKIVLNEGYPICQMPKCGYEDPRWCIKDDLYHASCSKKLELPSWAFSWLEDQTESGNDSNKSLVPNRPCQIKPCLSRGVKGIMLPVVRINACVVKDYGSSFCEPRVRLKSKERPSSRPIRSHSVGSDKSSLTEVIPRFKRDHEPDSHADHHSIASINLPKDHLCSRDELSLHLGKWYYLDGIGREHGPLLFSQLQDSVAKGDMVENTSVFRKEDNIWVPISKAVATRERSRGLEEKENHFFNHSSSASLPVTQLAPSNNNAFSSFHSSHPQFIGFTCGKLHELVMKSYKSREFAAAVNAVLDPWLNVRQPKELDKPFSFNSSVSRSSSVLSDDLSDDKFWRSGKRPRLMNDGSGEDYSADMDLINYQLDNYSFEDLFVDTASKGDIARFDSENEGWGLLSCHLLARVFHFLRNDVKSIIYSAATCKHWKSAVKFYRSKSRHVDFSTAGPNCTDPVFQNIMSEHDNKNITTLILANCINISPSALEAVLRLYPSIFVIDIRGCGQFRELISMLQNVRWIQNQNASLSRNPEEHSKGRSLKQVTDKGYSMAKSSRGSGYYLDNFGERGEFGMDFSNVNERVSASQSFRQGHYRRTKLLDARKSSGALSRDAQLKQLIWKKSENTYRKMEPLIADSLKIIMKENAFHFLVPKVQEIEDRMRSGYYVRHGLNSVKDDIRQMCRNAIKTKKTFNAGDLKQIISPFLQLVERLEKPKLSLDRDSDIHLSDSKYKKKQNKTNERRLPNRNASVSCGNGGMEHRAYTFDRQIKRSLSKLNKKIMYSESETSDEDELFDEEMDEGESTGSETESDLDLHMEVESGNQVVLEETMESTEEREWGARMTKASLVPPVTRKYEVIDHYLIVADEEEVRRKMTATLPQDYTEKLLAQHTGVAESDMEIPEVKDFKPRKLLGEEVIEQEVYGIDPYTHNLLLDSMPTDSEWGLPDRHRFIEQVILRALNKQVRSFTGSGTAPMVYQLQPIIDEIKRTAEEDGDSRMLKMCQGLQKAIRNRSAENYVAYRKGLGVICNKENGFGEDDFVVEFLGEVYPAWKWYEKQDGIRSLQKNSKDPLPEFYNINLERPKGDGDGYDLVVVDAMHKANYASRICHSCRPNCEAKVTAVDGKYQIGIYTLRPIAYGEEITFDYNSVTESKDEYEASVCLCGSQVCRGSYLNLTGEEAYQNVLKEYHGILDRHKLMLEACEAISVSQEDYSILEDAGLGRCLLDGLPDWLIAYSANLVRFINFERTRLPEEILKHNLEEKMKYIPNYNAEDDKNDAEIQAEGVYNQRLQNMAITIDKVKYVMRCVFENSKTVPPPLEKMCPEEVVAALWKGEGSLVNDLLTCLAIYLEADVLNELRSKIHAHDPSCAGDLRVELRKSLLWLREELRDLPCSHKCRNDAAADLIHMYAYTKYFFRVREYKSFTSPPVYISPLDMGPKYTEKMGSGFQEYCKTYRENYCLGQLIYWHNQTDPDPDCSLLKARRGCLSLPDVSSFYADPRKPLRKHIYGSKTLSLMLLRMEKQPQRPWPKDQIWEFKNSPFFLASPVLDAALDNCPLNKDMMHWLKTRPAMFQGARDG